MAKRDKWIRSGLELLEREGLAVGEPSPALIAPLKERFGQERTIDLAVVHLLGRIVDETSVATLEELAAAAEDKEVKREIRRSLFKLGQKGLAVSEKEAEPKDASKPSFSLTPEIEAYLSPIDGAGNYLLVLARPQMGSGLFAIQAAINDRQGLQRIGGALIRRKEFRAMMNEMKAAHGISMVPIPWPYGDWRLHAAYEQARGRGAEGIEEYTTLRSHLTNTAVKEEPHPIFSYLDREALAASAGLESSRSLLEENEFRMWVLDEDLIMPYVERARALKESRIVLSPIQQSERFEAVVKEAVDGIFLDDTMRPIFERRFEDVALHLLMSDREEKAKSVLRVALALERQEKGALVGIPLLEGLVRRSLAVYMDREQKEKAEEPSFIVKP